MEIIVFGKATRMMILNVFVLVMKPLPLHSKYFKNCVLNVKKSSSNDCHSQNKKVFVGTDMHVLQIFSHPENQTDGIVTRFTSTITHISVNKDGSKVAAGSGFADLD
jgi:hypothetical protein